MNKPLNICNKNYVLLSLCNFLTFFTFYSMSVALPMYMVDSFKNGDNLKGLVITVFTLGSVLCRPFTGNLVSSVGSKKLLLVSGLILIISSLGYVSGAYILIVLFLFRFVHGIGFAGATTSTNTMVLQFIPEGKQGEGLGYFSMFMNIASAAGPFISISLITAYGYGTFFLVVLSVCVCIEIISSILPDVSIQQKDSKKKAFCLSSIVEFHALPIALCAAILAFSYSGVTSFVSLYAREANVSSVARYFFIVASGTIVLTRPFTGKLLDKKGEKFVIIPGFISIIVGVLILSIVHSPVIFMLSALFIGFGYGALFSGFQNTCVKVAPLTASGLATATFFLLFDIGYAAGSFGMGAISSAIGYSGMYVVGAIIYSCGFILYYFVRMRKTNLLSNQ